MAEPTPTAHAAYASQFVYVTDEFSWDGVFREDAIRPEVKP